MARRGRGSSNVSKNVKKDVSHDDLEDFEEFRKRQEAENFRRMLDNIVDSIDDQAPSFVALLDSAANSEILNVLVITTDEYHRILSVCVSMVPIRYKFLKSKNRLYGQNETKENEKICKDVPDPYKFDED